MKIDCITAQKMIQPYLDRNLDDREASVFIAHVRHCPVCREELETAFLVDHALTFLDKDSSDSFDIARMVRDDLKEYERGMLLRSILNMLIWLGIALMTIVIFIILLRYIAPGVFRDLGRMLLHMLNIDTDYTLWELIRLRITGHAA